MRAARVRLSFNPTLLLGLVSLTTALPHGDGEAKDMGEMALAGPVGNVTMDTYFLYPEHRGWIYGHIAAMTVAWAILLPICVMLSIARSKYTILSQLSFISTHAFGLILGTIYNANTPDLYENNAHHKMGWIYTWLAATWLVIRIVSPYLEKSEGSGVTAANIAQYDRLHNLDEVAERRWSGDSGQGTERNSSSLAGGNSPDVEHEHHRFDRLLSFYRHADDDSSSEPEKRGFLTNSRIDRFLSTKIPQLAVGKSRVIINALYVLLERTLLILGFIALSTGAVTFGGVFRGDHVFSGLAHFIKGGIFFWYGIFTIGRWAGSFADVGWAWNIKPPAPMRSRWKRRTPSAEFIESALIFTYGATNVWMEHFAAWGKAWSAQDFEHVSITILFFGAGLLGMLVESRSIRALLNTSLLRSAPPTSSHAQLSHANPPTPHTPTWAPPPTSTTPLNPIPALTILLLGQIMSSHEQHSMLSSRMHASWGNLFFAAALARLVTYSLHVVRPPASHIPSRPPSELVAGFCLVAGGLLFMLSARDVVAALERGGWHAMVAFTVGMGVTAVVCAGTVMAVVVKEWAVGREGARRGSGA